MRAGAAFQCHFGISRSDHCGLMSITWLKFPSTLKRILLEHKAWEQRGTFECDRLAPYTLVANQLLGDFILKQVYSEKASHFYSICFITRDM